MHNQQYNGYNASKCVSWSCLTVTYVPQNKVNQYQVVKPQSHSFYMCYIVSIQTCLTNNRL